MKASSDNSNRGSDSGFRASGIGITPRFRCGRCDKPSSTTGSSMRLVRGLRTKVCAPCKTELDAKALPIVKLLSKRAPGKRVCCVTVDTGSALVNVTAIEARAFIDALELAMLKRGDPE